MGLILEIVPGQSIGPFRLGMTFQQIEEALQSLGAESPLTLNDLGIMAWSSKTDSPRVTDHCDKLGVRVFNNSHTVRLAGEPVNGVSNKGAIRLFESLGAPVIHSYGGFSIAHLGIDAVRWEDSDPYIDSFFVMPPQ